jgi:hypothetical protein
MQKLRILFAITLLVGAVLWNGWVFGFFNHGLAGYLHMSISELEVVGQPHIALFNFLEDASGICMMVGALGLIAVANRGVNIALLILLSIAAVGALTLYDVAYPLDCSRYNNPVCAARDTANEVSHTNVLHNDESRITAYLTIVLAVLIALWSHFIRLRRSELIALIVIAVSVIVTLAILDTNGNVLVNAVVERIWNVLVSIAIGYVAWKFVTAKHYRRHAASRT